MQVGRRYTQGFQYGLAYTYSKSFDYANDDSSDVNFGRPFKQFNYAPSDFDQTHPDRQLHLRRAEMTQVQQRLREGDLR